MGLGSFLNFDEAERYLLGTQSGGSIVNESGQASCSSHIAYSWVEMYAYHLDYSKHDLGVVQPKQLCHLWEEHCSTLIVFVLVQQESKLWQLMVRDQEAEFGSD